MAWLCALGPDAVIHFAELTEATEAIVAREPESYLYRNTLGAVLFRAGRFEDAARALDEAVRRHGRGGNAYDWLFLAMAHHRLGHPETARSWLAKAVPWIERAEQGRVRVPFLKTPLSPEARQELRLLSHEAEALLGRSPPELSAEVFARPAGRAN